MNINKININQSEPTYYIASDIYDVSYHNNGATFDSLSALLSSSNLSTLIPTAVRCGGMTIRFVQSSDNRYVQYRLMATSFSTNESDWQGIDYEPVYGSENLVKSGGIYNKIANIDSKNLYIPSTEIIDKVSYWNVKYNITLQAGHKYYVKHLSGYKKNLFTGKGEDEVYLVTDKWVEFIPNNTQMPLTYSSSEPTAPKVIFADADSVYQELKRIEDVMNNTDSSLTTDIENVMEKLCEKIAIVNYVGESNKIINTSGCVVAGSYSTQRVSRIIDVSSYDYLFLDLTTPSINNNACAFAFYDDTIDINTGTGLISVIQYPDIINNGLKILKPDGATKVIVGYLVNESVGWFGIKNFYGGIIKDAQYIIDKIDNNNVLTDIYLSNYSFGASYLDGDGKLQTSQYYNRFITNPIAPIPIKVNISGSRFHPMILFYDDNMDFVTGAGFISGISFATDINENVLITEDMIPSNATKMVFNGIMQLPSYFGVKANKLEILDNNALYRLIKDTNKEVAIYISPNGNDSNDGETASSPRLNI